MSPASRRRRAGKDHASRRGRHPKPPQRPEDPLVGSSVELDIERVAHGGHCIARHEGRVIFVRHTLPGERVRALVTEGRVGDSFLRADAVEILRSAPGRRPPRCPYSGPGGCGGCDWQHVDTHTQRALKTEVVREQLQRLAQYDWTGTVEPVPGDDDGLRWRTRVEFAVDADGRPGLRPHRRRDVIPVQDCPIAVPAVIDTGVLQRAWTGQRAVDVATSSTAEVSVVPVPGGEEQAPVLTEQVPTSTGPDLQLRVGARGFWQVHPGAARTFTDVVLQGLRPKPGERVIDLYCGVGLFAAAVRRLIGPAGLVLAVEGDPAAVRSARENLEPRADHAPVQVVEGRVDEVLAARRAAPADQADAADLVILDPPRIGAGAAVVREVAARQPRAIAYVACDPAALARDLRTFADAGYELADLRAFDAFPMTHHIECIALLHRS